MSIIGTRVLRREDAAILRGEARYVANLQVPELQGALVATYVRSTVAHGLIRSVDVSEAALMPGVVAVFTATDLDLAAPRPRMPWIPAEMARPWLAGERVRFVGEPVVVILSETAVAGEDAAEMVVLDIEPLPTVVNPLDAIADDAPRLHGITNLAWEVGPDNPDPDLFAGCEVVVEGSMVNQRLAPCPLEGRAAAASWVDGRLTMWLSTQAAHAAHGALAGALGLDRSSVRIVAPDVGGGFGAKISTYPEEILVGWLARRVQRPVRWVETRSESMLALGHGRDQHHTFTIGGSRDGRVQAYRLDIVANAGAYPAMAAFLPTFTRLMAPGTYDIERVETRARVVVTNTMSVEAYRGAGRPEATATIERAMDLFAAEIGMDAVELRRRNLIAAHNSPHTTATGAVYDAGDYAGALDAVLAAAGYDELRAEQARRRDRGEGPLLGIGVSTYVEITAGGGAPKEFGSVRVRDDGTALVLTGSSPHGQGLHTALASLVADLLTIDPEQVEVIHGDTDAVARGAGTMGSRSLQLGGAAVVAATAELVELARRVAAGALSTAEEDLVLADGRFHASGTPDVGIGWAELAEIKELVVDLDFEAPGPTFPFGAHVAVVEVDSETGKVTLSRHVACDDAGVIVNPLLADGQRFGGIAQGVAQALFEEMVYDSDGNPLTATFPDYGIVSAADLPSFELVAHETPTPYNPLGVKGIGESGTIGATPAVHSAVIDALSHLGVRHIDMPCTPEKVWRAMRDARSR
ncbi:MAG: xanthine dehydrogenase family protein molybdopterin-binding subunit [Microthrixaceae bacterium]|nr:xanthine dehydrogenase family protein molybdopterin-binding subunit [Microthrixaceae bacterium]